MRIERISWKKSERSTPMKSMGGMRTQGPSQWNPRLLGGILLLVALLIVYHGTEGQQMVAKLQNYLAGAQPTTTSVTTQTSPASASATMSTALNQLQTAAQTSDWQSAQGALHQLEMAWGPAENTYAKKGVATADLDGMTADLADMALAIATKNSTALMTDVQNAQKALNWMASETQSGLTPTLTQLTALVNDLNQAMTQGNYQKADQDAKALKQITDQMQSGF